MFNDAWYGEIVVERVKDRLAMNFTKTPSLVGDLEHWQDDTWIVRWHDRELRADAYVTYAFNPDGTIDQVKVTVFGPVVNLASRLETMTRKVGASILVDPATAAITRASVPPDVCRVRRLARVRAAGFSAPIDVSELLPPRNALPELTDEHLASYESALSAFEARDWPLALKHLHAVPPEDLALDFLTLFIAQHARTPPPNWDGAIPLEGK